MQEFRTTLRVPVPVETLFGWHERPGAFQRLAPPWDRPEVVLQQGGIRDGARVTLRVHTGPVPTTWELEHRDYIANQQFRDVLLRGPFAHWVHTHAFRADGPTASVLDDTIEYALPLGALGSAVAGGFTTSTLSRVFAYRQAVLLGDLERHALFADRPRLTIAIAGASGFIGTQLAAFLSTGGHTVRRIGRGAVQPGVVDISWDPERGQLDPRALEGVDAVINLSGASIASRWSAESKRRMETSRVEGTSLLAHAMAQLERKPSVFLSGSAIGIYGQDRGDERLTESSSRGDDFLARLGTVWEAATVPAERAGIRVVHLRTGIVQGAAGGVLATQLPIFRAGAGGVLGSGKQWLSSIALDDEIGAIHFCLMRDDIRGPVNLAAPEAVTNAEFTRVIGRILGRPTIAAVPAFALRTLLGREMADATALANQRVVPAVLQQAGFSWRFPTVESMLRFELGQAG